MTALERFNSFSHLLGALAAVAGTVWLLVVTPAGDPWRLTSFSIYGASLILLYAISSLSHGYEGRRRGILTRLDHCTIYLLIAGTYTPFTLVTLRGPWGWSLFGVVWGLAALGSLQELWLKDGARILSVVIYVLMGWAALAALFPLLDALGTSGFAWVAAGGVLYTVGIVFYALDTRMTHAHGIWHLFVLAGSAAHYFAILRYVL